MSAPLPATLLTVASAVPTVVLCERRLDHRPATLVLFDAFHPPRA